MDAMKIISSTGEPAFAVNQLGIIRAWNRAAESLFGFSASAVDGRHCWEVLCGCDAWENDYCGRHCPLRRMAYSARTVNSTRLLFRLASREVRPFLVSTLMLYNGPGEQLMAHICRPDVISSGTGDVQTEAAERPPVIRLTNNHRRGALTQRQHEVLSLLAAGKSTTGIAMLLCISEHTVRNHIAQILFKLHVHSRIEAISLGRQLGLI